MLTALSGTGTSAQDSSSFQGLGLLGTTPGSASFGNGISADGAAVAGESTNASGSNEAFRWTAAGGMQGLGFIGGGAPTRSSATGASADGAVLVGSSSDGVGQFQAFRWTQATGMQGLGFLPGGGAAPGSSALAVNADGSVLVGRSTNGAGATEAFRWTQATGMQGLGFLGVGPTVPSNSFARGVSADGAVVVGQSTNAADQNEAFRWTQATGLQGLGFLPGGTVPNSGARGISADGRVVIGNSSSAGSGVEAFRWTQATGMQGLGLIGGGGVGSRSFANGVSADGSVIVGDSSNAAGQIEAFRWTQATGMRSLAGLLAGAGVSLNGFTALNSASAVSANGQFITGFGADGSNRTQAWLARYVDGSTPAPPVTPTPTPDPTLPSDPAPTPLPAAPPIAGITSFRAVQGSLDALAAARQRVALHHHGLVAPLLGASLPIGDPSHVGIYAAGGSAAGGGFGRVALGNGFALLGGLAYQTEGYRNAELKDAVTGALAARFVFRPSGNVNPFVEAGGWFAPDARFRFRRPYANGAGLAVGITDPSGSLSYVYGRLGLALPLASGDEMALSGEIGQERLRVDSAAEPLTAGNPFEARVFGSTDRLDVAKIRAQWTHPFTPEIDATIYAAGAFAFAGRNRVVADVAGFGPLVGDAGRPTWIEYGVRVGYKLTAQISLDAFADATSGSGWSGRQPGFADRSGAGTRVHAGAAFRYCF